MLIIPSEKVEFPHNIYGRISNFQMGRIRLVQYLRELFRKNVKPRKVIILSSDKQTQQNYI